jgi:hypothetical protein
MRILVLDTIHGGMEIARFLHEQGHFIDVTDVYRGKTGLDPTSASARVYDLAVAPVHLNPFHPLLRALSIPVITHHQAVRWILGTRRPSPLVEITGARGKTTTAIALATVMKNPGIVHTSLGTFRYPEKTLIWKSSITPASLVPAAREAARMDGWLIAEESLGLSGSGDFGIITSADDYLFAGGMRHALQEKIRSGQGMTRLLVAPGIDTPGTLKVEEIVSVDGDKCTYRFNGIAGGFHNQLLLIDGYRTPLMLAAAAGCVLGYDPVGLSSFQAIEGRMSTAWQGHILMVDNANSGTNGMTTINAALYAREMTGKNMVVLVIGKEPGAVCEGFPAADVEDAIRTIYPDQVILVGDSYDQVQVPDAVGVFRCSSFDEGRESAIAMAREGSIVLAVKSLR